MRLEQTLAADPDPEAINMGVGPLAGVGLELAKAHVAGRPRRIASAMTASPR